MKTWSYREGMWVRTAELSGTVRHLMHIRAAAPEYKSSWFLCVDPDPGSTGRLDRCPGCDGRHVNVSVADVLETKPGKSIPRSKNLIEMLGEEIQAVQPAASYVLTRPRRGEWTWWLDASYNDRRVTIEWSPDQGFGVGLALDDALCGEEPDENFTLLTGALKRVLELLHVEP